MSAAGGEGGGYRRIKFSRDVNVGFIFILIINLFCETHMTDLRFHVLRVVTRDFSTSPDPSLWLFSRNKSRNLPYPLSRAFGGGGRQKQSKYLLPIFELYSNAYFAVGHELNTRSVVKRRKYGSMRFDAQVVSIHAWCPQTAGLVPW